MAEHVWSVLCHLATVDERTHVISLLAVLERLEIDATAEQLEELLAGAENASAQAMVPTQLEFVSWWVRSDYSKPETITARTAFITPSGKRLPGIQSKINLERATGFRTKMLLPGFPYGGLGLYWIIVEKQSAEGAWETVARSPIELALAANPQEAVTSSTAPAPPSEPTPAAPRESS